MEPTRGSAGPSRLELDIEIKTNRFPGHPQETTENSVDLGHLRYVHGYGSVDRIEPVSVDGPCLESR